MTQYWRQCEEDERGDLVDVDYYCAESCAETAIGERINALGVNGMRLGMWEPALIETDYTTFCAGCTMPLWYGMQDAKDIYEQLTASIADARPHADDFTEGGEAFMDVRVQALDGEYILHTGDACYDTDHRGHWGATSIDVLTANNREIGNVTHDLLEEALDAMGAAIAIR